MLRRGMMAQAAGGGTDPYWANVVSLLHFDGTDGSTTFTDAKSRVWTPAGNAQIDTSLGYNTGLFDGTGDYVTTPYVQADFDWWTSDFTIEAWIYVNNLSDWYFTAHGPIYQPVMIGNGDVTAAIDYWSFGPINTGAIQFYYWNGAPNSVTSAATVPTGALVHVAMSKNASGIRLAVNGVVESAVAISGTPLTSGSYPMTLGQMQGKSINGHVRALRITKGVARYTSNFTPPSAPFPNS